MTIFYQEKSLKQMPGGICFKPELAPQSVPNSRLQTQTAFADFGMLPQTGCGR